MAATEFSRHMKKNNFKWVVLVSILILPIVLYITFVYGLKDVFFVPLSKIGPKEVSERTLEDGTTVYDTTFYTVPPFKMVNQKGEVITDQDLLGKYYVASFFFASCPSICPAMNFHLKQVSDRFQAYDEFYMVSFSVDPKRDTVEALEAYARQFGVEDRNWYFLTGDQDRTHELASGYLLGANEDALAEGGFYHAEGVVIVDWNGHIRSRKDDNGNILGNYDVLSASALKDLEEDLKVMKAEYERWKHNQ